MTDSDTTDRGPLEGPTTVARDIEIDGETIHLEVRDPPRPELEEWDDRLQRVRRGDADESETEAQQAYIDEFVLNHDFNWERISLRRQNILFTKVQQIHSGSDEFLRAFEQVQVEGNGTSTSPN